MYITKIELEDIKSHANSKFEFQRGTTAITGENGAGKTTLIEAVAWTLFDLLDYKKDTFARRGTKKGIARVTFESSLDERLYVVHRDTKTGYYVYDPELKIRVADKKEEVRRFLWQHLGVEPGTDLEALFRRAIGVPQGTFTAIFLETPTERKKAFDKLLKVEEYRQGADKLRETVNFIKTQQIDVGNRISFAEGKLAEFETKKENLKNLKKDAKTLRQSFGQLEKEVMENQETVKELDETEARVSNLKTSFEKIRNESSRTEVIVSQKEDEKKRAAEAADRIKEAGPGHQIHLKALGMLKEFERERIEREKLRTELNKIETALVNVKADEKTTREELAKALRAHQKIEELKPKTVRQKELETRRESLSREIAKADEVRSGIDRLEEKLRKLRVRHTENTEQIKRARKNQETAQKLESSQKRNDEITSELAGFRAKLDRDQKFQSEIKTGLCPILSEKCLNLKPGQTLEDFVSDQFSDTENRITTLEMEQKDVSELLKSAKKAEIEAAGLPNLLKRRDEITDEGKGLREEQDTLGKKLETLPDIEKELAGIKTELETLGSPRERIGMLKKEAEREISIRDKITNIESNLERLESDRRLKVEQLEVYKDLDQNWEKYSASRDETVKAHREFLANEAAAESLAEKEKALEDARRELATLNKELQLAKEKFETADKDYDRSEHVRGKDRLRQLERDFAETRVNLKHAENRREELETELAHLKEIRISMKKDVKERERLEKIGDATAFIRTTLKKAAPLVARNYVHHVSIEANQMFREITGNAERTLKWANDYGILLEENGYERPFQNLSGGEQMAAALSVRLALLKQLSDVSLAFFDEPTTNMDTERRERLAEQISRITEKQTFDQLFVISHDDTFEGHVDNVITIRGDETV